MCIRYREEVVALQKQMHEQYEPIIEQAEARLKEQQAQEARLQAQLADPALSQAEKAALETQLQLVQREIAQLKRDVYNRQLFQCLFRLCDPKSADLFLYV